MAIDRSREWGAMPAAIVLVALIAAFVTLAIVQPEVAVMLVIFGFLFGTDLLGELVAALRESSAEPADEDAPNGEPADPLEQLRTRYANGELSDEAFERRLAVLLETETVADVERFLAGESNVETDHDRSDSSDSSDHESDRELERSSR